MPETTSTNPFAAFVAERPGFPKVIAESNKALACYYGGDSLIPYILKYSSLEDEAKFQWRQGKIIENFENYAQEIAQQYVEGITRAGTIVRETKNIDLDFQLKESYSKWFKKDLMPMALMLPEVYVQLCKPPAAGPVMSKQDALDQKLMPYAVLVFPQFVQNFQAERDNKINWITIKQGDNFEIWDAKEVVTIDKEGKAVVPKKLHGFKRCPFIRVLWRENKAIAGTPKPGYSFMFNITMQTLSLLTWVGQLQESALFHLYPKLVWDEDTKKMTQKQGGIGADTPLTEPSGPDVGGKTRYLTMPGTEMEILERITYERKQASIYRMARLRDRSIDKNQSGAAKRYDMIPEVSVLTDIAEYIYDFDKEIVLFMAEEWIENLKLDNVSITYPRTYDNKSTAEVMNQVADYQATVDGSSLPTSITAQKIIAKKIAIATCIDLSDLSDANRKKIEAEIDAAPVEKVVPAAPPIPKEPPLKAKTPVNA